MGHPVFNIANTFDHQCFYFWHILVFSWTQMLFPPLTRIHHRNTTINHLHNITDITNSFDFGKLSIFEEVRILVNWLQHAYLNAKHVEPSSEVTCDKTDFCFIPKVDASPDQAETALRVTQQQHYALGKWEVAELLGICSPQNKMVILWTPESPSAAVNYNLGRRIK